MPSTVQQDQSGREAASHVRPKDDIRSENSAPPRSDFDLPPEPKLYKRRWLMLALFSMIGFLQCTIWNTWGPIAPSARLAFPEINADTVSSLSFVSNIATIVALLPVGALLQQKGLRWAMIFSCGMMVLGTSLRCLPVSPHTFVVLSHVCAALNGVAGVVVGVAPGLLSSLWFPIKTRNTATAIGCTFNQLGSAGGFFLGPMLVRNPFQAPHHPPGVVGLPQNYPSKQLVAFLQNCIANYMYIVCMVSIALLILVVVYFEDEPPTPPIAPLDHEDFSRSASSRPLSRSLNSAKFRRHVPSDAELPASFRSSGRSAHTSVRRRNVMCDDTPRFSAARVMSDAISTHHVSIGIEGASNNGMSPPQIEIERASENGAPVALKSALSTTPHSYTTLSPYTPASTTCLAVPPHISQSVRFDVPAPPTTRLEDFLKVVKINLQPLKSPSFDCLLVAYAVCLGIQVAWSSVLDINLEPIGVTQSEAAKIGVTITVCSVALSVVFSRIADKYFGNLKRMILGTSAIAILCNLWLTLLCNGVIEYNLIQVWVAAAMAGSFNYAASPLFFELAMELGHPTPEDMVGGMLLLSWNIVALVFLALMKVPALAASTVWMNYALVGQSVAVLVLVSCVAERYKRSGPVKTQELERSEMVRSAQWCASVSGRYDGDDHRRPRRMQDDSDSDEDVTADTAPLAPRRNRAAGRVRAVVMGSSSESERHWTNAPC